MKKSTKAIVIGYIVFSLFFVAVIIYLCQGLPYREYFLEGTLINGQDCTKMTVEEVEKRIEEETENYQLSIAYKDDKTQVITVDQISYRYQSNGQVQEFKNQQNWLLWFWEREKKHEYTVSNDVQYDKQQLLDVLNSFECLQQEAQIEPVDSQILYENGKFFVSPSVEGRKIDVEALHSTVKKAIANRITSISVEQEGLYILPKVTEADTVLQTNCETLNKYASASITYVFSGESVVLDGNTIKDWLSVDDDGLYYKDDKVFTKKIQEFVTKLIRKYDTSTFLLTSAISQTNGTMKNTSHHIWKMNEKQEISRLTQEIEQNVTIMRQAEYSMQCSTLDAGNVGTTFVEIDLTAQHAWYHLDGEIVWDTDIVSGTGTDYSRRTPSGTYYIYNKERNRILRGSKLSDGSYSYETPVSYWMPFNGGIGLHDASWRDAFGGEIYQYDGSHGCINLPYEKAEELYSFVSIGTKVICYY